MIVSFYNDNVKQEVVAAQKKVFSHLNVSLNQIKYGDESGSYGHGLAIDEYLKTSKEEVELICDIDCVPTDRQVIFNALNISYNNIGIYSVAQRASHIKDSPLYASPAFISFSRDTYNLLGCPSFKPTVRGDTGSELTYAAREKGVEVRLLYPTSCDVPIWDLDGWYKFGFGTTYGNKIYHCFNARFEHERFIKKCNEICGG